MEITGGSTRRAAAGYRAVFDRLFEGGRSAVRSGGYYRDTPPVEGGRWGPSVVLRPPPSTMDRLAAVTTEAMRVAGPGHWPTGAAPSIHITVRALQAYRGEPPAADAFLRRCAQAVRRATRSTPQVAFRFRGLTLTPSGVMACAYPMDGTADVFAARLRDDLGADGWFEENFHRDIWYATLVHFATDIVDPIALVDWVEKRRDTDLGPAIVSEAELLWFRYDGRQPVRMALATAAFGSGT
jgi:hypothetical protein